MAEEEEEEDDVMGVELSVTVMMLVDGMTSQTNVVCSERMQPFSTSFPSRMACLALSAASRASLCCRKRWNRRRTGWSGGKFNGASSFLFSLSSSSSLTSLIFRKTICRKARHHINFTTEFNRSRSLSDH